MGSNPTHPKAKPVLALGGESPGAKEQQGCPAEGTDRAPGSAGKGTGLLLAPKPGLGSLPSWNHKHPMAGAVLPQSAFDVPADP